MSFVEKRVWSYTGSTVQIKKALLAIYSYESWNSAKNLRLPPPPSNFKWPFSPVFKSIPPYSLLPSSLSKPPNYKNPPPSFSSPFQVPPPSFRFLLPLSDPPSLFQIPCQRFPLPLSNTSSLTCYFSDPFIVSLSYSDNQKTLE